MTWGPSNVYKRTQVTKSDASYSKCLYFQPLLTELTDMTKDPFTEIIYVYGIDEFATVIIRVGKESNYFMTERKKWRYQAPLSEMTTTSLLLRFLSHGQDIC